MGRDPRLDEVRHRQLCEPQRIGELQVMAVRPRELLLVEHAGAVADGVEREAARELVDRQQLVVAAGRPADQREVVDQRLRQVPLRTELADRGRAVPLRQRRVIGPHHHGQMRELGRCEPERLVEQNLPRRVRDVILAADHMRDLHQRIVHDHGEVVRRRAVGANDHRIADHLGLKTDLAADGVGEDDLASLGHAKADRRPLARRNARAGLLAWYGAARAGIERRPPGLDRLPPLRLELRSRAEAVVRRVGVQQLFRVRLVEVQPLGLAVRTERAAEIGPLIPVETEPAQIAEDRRLRLAGRALGIGVLDAQNERAALPAREEPVEERRARVAHVQLAGRAGSESHTHVCVS